MKSILTLDKYNYYYHQTYGIRSAKIGRKSKQESKKTGRKHKLETGWEYVSRGNPFSKKKYLWIYHAILR